ncbi:MAG: DUF4038 domain-containing protein [Anaerolineales bacterium]|nr:DUF4038 domain-containing protein [Anaerolineales bacterium]
MKRVNSLLLVCMALGLGLTPPSAHAAASAPAATATAEQWRIFEISLTSTVSYANPFSEVAVTAVFYGPDQQMLTRPGFGDGGDTWRVRVAFPAVGRWMYRISASDPANAGLHRPLTPLVCVPYAGYLPIYQHGFLTVSADQRYLQHADGTPFLWLGDTHWFFEFRERWDESNDPRWPSQFKALVDRRVAQGYSIYQSVIFGPAPALWAPGEIGTRIDPEYFQNALDPKLAYIADRGLVNALGLGFHTNIDGRADALAGLARYVVARYGAYPMVWITGGEVGGYEPELRAARLDGWRQVALAIDAADSYHQPQSAHYTNDFPTDYLGESWLDFSMVQGGHHSAPVETLYYQRYYQAEPATPFLEAEANYEGLGAFVSADLVRATAYRAIQSGSLGYTYGAQGIWNAVWDTADTANDFGGPHWNWNQAIDFKGGQQVAYLGRFYRRVPWQTLRPRWVGVLEYAPQDVDANRPLATADTDAGNVVVYLPSGFTAQGSGATIVNLPDRTYAIRWYDPRTGAWLYQGNARVGLGRWQLEPAPAGEDWLVWLTAVPAPGADREAARAAAQANLALGRAYTSSGNADAAPAFDGDDQTAWQAPPSTPDAPWLEVDFGQPVTFNTAVLREFDYHTRAYRLEVWDGAAWQIAYRGTLIGHEAPTRVSFPPQTTRRARLIVTAAAAPPSIREWGLYLLPDRGQARAAWKR